MLTLTLLLLLLLLLVNIADNNLKDKGLGPLLKALANIPTLVSLDISQNEIGPVSAECLSDFLSRGRTGMCFAVLCCDVLYCDVY
jgi:Ran GTPase-activating protein (RanGAP) involved in mRNA processing and transport